MNDEIFEIMEQQNIQTELGQLLSFNKVSSQFGLSLSYEEAEAILEQKNESLRTYQRVEFGKSIVEQVMEQFCDSPYLYQDTYADIIGRLTDIFYEFKNETGDLMTDEELLSFMKHQFNSDRCTGDLDYLEGTCLPRMVDRMKAGADIDGEDDDDEEGDWYE